MAKMNYTAATSKPTIELACEEIQDNLLNAVGAIEPVLQRVRNLVRGQKAAILTEFGNDNATALLAVFTKLKEAVEAAKDVTIEGLPTE